MLNSSCAESAAFSLRQYQVISESIMEKRAEALREALSNNTEEANRWETFMKENQTAIENLENFSKNLTVDVMVPLGRKAFMPGQLIHTNEVLVGHYQGYFSKCTAHKAKQICDLRIDRAKDQLKQLQAEAELWQNKLEKPYFEGVLPQADEREIIEDYDEEKEQLWREAHKLSVKNAKLKEKNEREQHTIAEVKATEKNNTENGDKDIFEMLEEAEIMEELEKELDILEIDDVNDETVKKLLAGQIPQPKEKNRKAHNVKAENAASLNGVVKKTNTEYDIVKNPPATNNNTRSNPDIEIIDNINNENNDDITEETRVIREQAKFLPVSDRVGFYEYQVEIIQKKLESLSMVSEQDIEKKLHLFAVQEELEDLLAMAEDELVGNEDTNELISNDEQEEEKPVEKEANKSMENNTKNNTTQKRQITFALENETLLFRRNEAVSQMLPKRNSLERDIIELDDNVIGMHNAETTYSFVNKQKTILEKVEKNLQFAAENKSPMDCDLITKIINEKAKLHNQTVYIQFQHSAENSIENNTEEENDLSEDFIPAKPSDFYRLYEKQLEEEKLKIQTNVYGSSYIGEEGVKAPILREVNRDVSYEDPRSKYSNPNYNADDAKDSTQTKSILRNKSAVEQETHLTPLQAPIKKQKKKKNLNEEEYMSAYNKVMQDVIEKPLVIPEPLPQGKYIDAHAPKKRVSRFKQMRSDIEKT